MVYCDDFDDNDDDDDYDGYDSYGYDSRDDYDEEDDDDEYEEDSYFPGHVINVESDLYEEAGRSQKFPNSTPMITIEDADDFEFMLDTDGNAFSIPTKTVEVVEKHFYDEKLILESEAMAGIDVHKNRPGADQWSKTLRETEVGGWGT